MEYGLHLILVGQVSKGMDVLKSAKDKFKQIEYSVAIDEGVIEKVAERLDHAYSRAAKDCAVYEVLEYDYDIFWFWPSILTDYANTLKDNKLIYLFK